MQNLDIGSVKHWTEQSNPKIPLPYSIGIVCPHCSSNVVVTTSGNQYDQHRKTLSTSGKCPACDLVCHFWLTNLAPGTSEISELELFIRPVTTDHMRTLPTSDAIPKSLAASYASAVQSYNSHNHVATTVLCRRTLEGVFKHLLPEDKRKGNLAKMIKEVEETVDLTAPLNVLSNAIREGGNLGAHFDPDNEPDAKMAKAMLELLAYLIRYLYLLPSDIKRLEEYLSSEPIEPSA